MQSNVNEVLSTIFWHRAMVTSDNFHPRRVVYQFAQVNVRRVSPRLGPEKEERRFSENWREKGFEDALELTVVGEQLKVGQRGRAERLETIGQSGEGAGWERQGTRVERHTTIRTTELVLNLGQFSKKRGNRLFRLLAGF